VYGNGVDELLSRGASTTVLWYNTDRKGSVRFLTSNAAAGAMSGTLAYDGYGKISAGTSVDRYTYTGREYDADTTSVAGTGLLHLRDRVFSNDLGRFLSRDRLGFDAGDLNLTRYVGNGYVNASDPSGYEKIQWLNGKKSEEQSNKLLRRTASSCSGPAVSSRDRRDSR
jgi:RHS repeat-associated protein